MPINNPKIESIFDLKIVGRVVQWTSHHLPRRRPGFDSRLRQGWPGHQAVIGTGFILVIMLGGYQ
jgi:hypothetical protein